jgi:hypothetical protein
MQDSDPYLGAIVHFRRKHRERCYAAIMTGVDRLTKKISLRVFAPGGDEYIEAPEHSADFGYSWHWRTECPG